ncbi:MAG: nucleotidyl transferase AbiEii/AbiGii toxin family protein [Bryobacter sp.]
MSTPLLPSKDFKEFVELLNARKVDYLVVGGYAVAWHGHPRFTADIDFFVRRGLENGEALEAVLVEFGFRSLGIQAADFLLEDQIFQLGHKPLRIDLITSIAGVDFETAWEHRVAGEIAGLPVNFISYEDLLINKEATGRPQDLADLDKLRKRKPKKA